MTDAGDRPDAPPATDWGALYRLHVGALAALAGQLDQVQLNAHVPATPEWTVRDVFAHLAGGPADLVAGRMDGAPGDPWTGRHVAERRGRTMGDLLGEMQRHEDAVAASVVDNPTPAIVWDIAVHHADLHEALGLARLPERFWAPVVAAVGPVRAAGLVGQVPDYELFRALFSRRSRSQMQAWVSGGSGAPGVSGGAGVVDLDAVPVFGPRDDDQPVPEEPA